MRPVAVEGIDRGDASALVGIPDRTPAEVFDERLARNDAVADAGAGVTSLLRREIDGPTQPEGDSYRQIRHVSSHRAPRAAECLTTGPLCPNK